MITKLKLILCGIFKKIYDLLIKTGIHRKLPVMASVYDFLFQHLWPYQNVIEIQGSKMYINVRDKDSDMRRTFQAYAVSGVHEKATTALFKKVVKEGDGVVDLGANIGYFTLLAAKLVGNRGKVYAFEPEPKNYYYLLKNIELNGYDNVSAIQKAVSDKNGIAKLFICPYDTGHHTINQREGIEDYRHGRPGEVSAMDIETVTLDEFMKNRESRIDVIKIDVEGAEALAISGMKETLKTNKNIKIFLEFFPFLIKKMGNSPKELIELLLKDFNFNIFVIGGDYSMEKFQKSYFKISDYEDLIPLLKKEDDHINLYLAEEANLS